MANLIYSLTITVGNPWVRLFSTADKRDRALLTYALERWVDNLPEIRGGWTIASVVEDPIGWVGHDSAYEVSIVIDELTLEG